MNKDTTVKTINYRTTPKLSVKMRCHTSNKKKEYNPERFTPIILYRYLMILNVYRRNFNQQVILHDCLSGDNMYFAYNTITTGCNFILHLHSFQA